VSVTLRPVVQCYELALGGTVSSAAADALDGFKVVGADDHCTYLTGRVESQGHLYDVLETIRDFNIDLVSLRPLSDEPI
jgi:hypothetical protein